MASLSYSKGNNFITKFYKNCCLKISSRLFCVCKELSTTSNSKMKFLMQSTYIRYVIAKLLKLVKSTCRPPQIPFLWRILWKFKSLELVSRLLFSYNFLIKNLLCNVTLNWPNLITRLCLVPKLFSKICSVSCLGIWWRHDIWITEKLKFDYLMNKKNFTS